MIFEKLKNLKNNSGFRKYFENTSWVFAEKILRIFAALFVGVWVTRYLGPKNLGILSYAQSFVAIFLAFSTLGINTVLVRELVKNPKDKSKLLGTSFALQTVGSVFLLTFLLIGINLSENDDFTNKIILLLGSVTFFQSFQVIGLYFQSIVYSKVVVIGSVISLAVTSLLKIALILTESPLIYFVYAIISETILIAIGLIYFYLRENESIRSWFFSKNTAKRLLRDSWPLILSTIVVSIYMKVDQVMIKEFYDSNSVGQYAAAVRLSEAWYFIPTVICSSLFPAIVNAKGISEKLYYNRIQNLYDFMVYISLSIAIPMTFMSDLIVDFLYGNAFQQTGEVLSIHIWAGIFVFLGVSRGGWILNENLQRYTSLYLGVGMLANIALNFILIPKFGILGAAWATLIAQSISVLFAPLLFKPTRISFFMMIKALTFYRLFKMIGTSKRQNKSD